VLIEGDELGGCRVFERAVEHADAGGDRAEYDNVALSGTGLGKPS